MAYFRFQKISNTKKIRYILKLFKNTQFIVFLHGFMSDLEGEKPNAFLKFLKIKKFGIYSILLRVIFMLFFYMVLNQI